MPHTRSAAKRLRQNEQRRLRNQARITEVKTLRKRLQRALHDGKPADADAAYVELSKRIDQASSAGTVHRNLAARWKSRLATSIAKAKAAPTKAAEKSTAKPRKTPAKAPA